LVDPGLVDFRSLGDEVRFRIFDYLWSKGVRSSELGVDPTYANKTKNRKARVSDALLERMLRMLSVDEFAMLVGSTVTQQSLQQLTVREPQSLGEAAIALDQYVRGLELDEKYPGTGEEVAEALVKAVKEWESLLEYAEIKDVEESVKAGVQPILELKTERGIVRVLSNDGAVLDVHGGFLNPGDCVVVAESTFAYTELVGWGGEL
jgi:hypothetical protein